jgi:hypothetical protein
MEDSELIEDDEPRSEDGTESEAEMDEDGNLRDFVVPDDDELIEYEEGFGPSDRRLEDDWDKWEPRTEAEMRFKYIVDKLTSKASGKKTLAPR